MASLTIVYGGAVGGAVGCPKPTPQHVKTLTYYKYLPKNTIVGLSNNKSKMLSIN